MSVWTRQSWACLVVSVIHLGVPCGPANADQATGPQPAAKAIGRPVRVVSIAFMYTGKPLEEVVKAVAQEAAKGCDIILLPETWHSEKPEPLDGPAVSAMAPLAKKYKTYIVCSIDRWDGKQCFNTAVLLDRQGRVACKYDKLFPTTVELGLKPPRQPGKDTVVYQADFGRIGLATCFDVSFPEVMAPPVRSGRRAGPLGQPILCRHLAASTLPEPQFLHRQLDRPERLHGGRHYRRDPAVRKQARRHQHQPSYARSGPGNLLHRLQRGKTRQTPQGTCQRRVLEKWMPRECWFVITAKRPGISARAWLHNMAWKNCALI